MNGTFDIYTLLFLVLAVFIFLRLRNVLGRRTGNERRPYDPYTSAREGTGQGAGSGDDNVVSLPTGDGARNGRDGDDAASDAEKRIREFMPDGETVTDGLIAISKLDTSFDPQEFLQGSKTAYEMIVTSFAEGNKKQLKQLLGRDVYDSFSSAIIEREDRSETVDSSFVGISSANVIDAELKNKSAQVTVKFVSELITATRNNSGEVIDGDPTEIREVTDIWTFARDVTSRDPNWKLIATQSAN